MSDTQFDVLKTELKGTKLIEASAGTGKTYSIAILVLRLIIEKEMPLEKILMVTFTKAATAELESRIRDFVRTGYKYLKGKIEKDEKDTIQSVMDAEGKNKEQKIVLLEKAIQDFDKLSVMTIHSFCQNTIDEFTFETGQPFDYEVLSDDTDLLKKASNQYVREIINTMDPEAFKERWESLKFSELHNLLRNYLCGMKFIDYDKKDASVKKLKEGIDSKKSEFDDFLKSKFPQIKEMDGSNAIKKDAINGNLAEFKRRFRDQIKDPKGYFKKFAFMKDEFVKFDQEVAKLEQEYLAYFYVDFFKKAAEEIKKTKLKKGYIFYADQINTLHAVKSNENFKAKLAQKYEAVFIDEFQDTDKKQYEIFDTIFSGRDKTTDAEPVIFYIGDPKQSIYGWRGADLDNYKIAKKSVETVETMNTNYRSTPQMIKALNVFLNPDSNYNLFIDDEIKYKNVETSAPDLGKIIDNDSEVRPITIWKFNANDDERNFNAVAREIGRILKENVKIKGEKVKPIDIGVLVRSGKEGDTIKELLSQMNIPAVKRDDKKVLKSDEARMISYLLKAVISPSRGSINRVLLCQWHGYTVQSIAKINDEEQIKIFIDFQKIVREEGVYNMISSFISAYSIRSICMKATLGQRVLTNINHIAEILHTKEKQYKYTPEELLLWLDRSTDTSSEEFEQRIESDDDAVNISTIHKAKGLEYKIVFAPTLCMIPKFKLLGKNKVNNFKKEGEYYFTFNYPALNEKDKELNDLQKEQENRRLIYVTLTRAVYKCYLSYMPRIYGSGKKSVESSLEKIVSYQKGQHSDLIDIKDFSEEEIKLETGDNLPVPESETHFSPRPAPEIEIKNSFGIHSFSALSRTHHSAPFEKTELGDSSSYDQFIYQNLPRGANVGNALHSIFERLDFSSPTTWSKTLSDASKYYSTIIKEESFSHFEKLISHVMNAEIECNGEKLKLSELTNGQKLPELEFLFSVDKVNKQVVNEYLGEDAKLGGEADIEGLMTGFIDLTFEYNGKYYILDWKSNYLGNLTSNYERAGMEAAMAGNNYHLQYMIYTVALKRWLETKIENFDFDKHFGGVIYLFLRGARKDSSTGVFTARPKKSDIEKLDKTLNK